MSKIANGTSCPVSLIYSLHIYTTVMQYLRRCAWITYRNRRYKFCKPSVLIVVVYQKNVNLAYLLVDVLIAVVNRKKKDVVAGE